MTNEIHMKLNTSKPRFTLCRAQYLYLALAGISLFFGLFAHVRAEEATSSLPQTLQERRDVREELQTERADAREERRVTLSAQLQERLTNLIENAHGRMSAAHTRLTNITARLDSRIDKLNERGVETKAAEDALKNANASLSVVKATLDDIKSMTPTALVNDTPRESMTELRLKFTQSREALLSAREWLRQTVVLLKEAVKDADLGRGVSDAVRNENSATSSPTTIEE